jgi:hypothetical protein
MSTAPKSVVRSAPKPLIRSASPPGAAPGPDSRVVRGAAQTSPPRGSLIETYKRCGRPNCHCVDGPGHGPKPKAGPMPPHQRFRFDNRNDRQDRWKPSIHPDEEPAVAVSRLDAAPHPPPQDDQLMSKHGILSLKPDLRLEW